jgi:CheY-like chemotaxis protein
MPTEINSNNSPEIPAHFTNLHILLADDEEFNLFLIKNVLKKWGISFQEAGDGKKASELALIHNFDLILMDLRMPIMDGHEAAGIILKGKPASLIIGMTGTTSDTGQQKILQEGMKGLLQKPFIESEIFNLLIELFPSETTNSDQRIVQEKPPLDLDDLRKMTGGDHDFFNEMLKIFIRSSENGLDSMRVYFINSDWEAISGAAHKLAAPAKHIHARELYNNLKKLENEVERMEREEIKLMIDTIESEVLKINSYFKQILSEN